MRSLTVIALLGSLLFSCNPNKREPQVVELKPAPVFNEDSAYRFIEEQIAFGFRIPGTEAHEACGNYLASKLTSYGFAVSEQKDTIVGYDNKLFPLRNISAILNPQAEKRILLCAHWDSRPFADQGDEDKDQPIVGANDNASGVAVILEMARIMGQTPSSVGVEIVLFDMEDQGRPTFQETDNPDDHGYCLGSKYWSENLTGAKPDFGILLNMVGAANAEFTLEHFSWEHASQHLLELWDLGNQLGYDQHFIYNRTHIIFDDHMHVNQLAGIPCVAIIHQDVKNRSLFWDHWHTKNDQIEVIDIETLRAVGSTCVQMVYNQ
ncbi:MAG: M28 family peptidase [Flavobacteriales bacterium]|nr:M28 family peptidase [Flavobacteriales bacterium]